MVLKVSIAVLAFIKKMAIKSAGGYHIKLLGYQPN
jgi:hypothetical protein